MVANLVISELRLELISNTTEVLQTVPILEVTDAYLAPDRSSFAFITHDKILGVNTCTVLMTEKLPVRVYLHTTVSSHVHYMDIFVN